MPTRKSYTTLELARVLADAAIRAYVMDDERRSRDNAHDRPTQAILRTLERTQHGFTAYDVDAHGVTIGGTERLIK